MAVRENVRECDRCHNFEGRPCNMILALDPGAGPLVDAGRAEAVDLCPTCEDSVWKGMLRSLKKPQKATEQPPATPGEPEVVAVDPDTPGSLTSS
jgi:hypothetical protein